MLTRMLNNHPDLWITYDSVHFLRFSYNQYNPIADQKNQEALLREIHVRILKRWSMSFDIEKIIKKLRTIRDVAYADVYDNLMLELAGQYKTNFRGWGEKTVLCWSKIDTFLKMFPKGRIIHILRDPRDILCSFKKLTNAPFPGYLNTAFVALDSFHSCILNCRAKKSDNYMIIRYEDMVSKPEKASRMLCNFLDIKFNARMLDVMRFTDKANGWWSGNSVFEEKMTQIDKSPIGRWKTIASNIEIFFMELVNKTTMPLFGYELSGIDLNDGELRELFDLLNHDCLADKYRWWMKTGQGIEGFSTDRAEQCNSVNIQTLMI